MHLQFFRASLRGRIRPQTAGFGSGRTSFHLVTKAMSDRLLVSTIDQTGHLDLRHDLQNL